MAGKAGRGAARLGAAGRGKARRGRRGVVGYGWDWRGLVGSGEAWQAGRGGARRGKAWQAGLGEARRGGAGQGVAWHGYLLTSIPTDSSLGSMHWLGKLALGITAWETGWWLVSKLDRRRLYDQAKTAAVARGKPLLVVGEPDGEYPCGDVTVDLRETSVCPVYKKANVENLSQFGDKQFGAAFVSHVIEHVCDPQKALAELTRVSDQVFIVYPRPWRLATLLVPGHRWIITKQGNGNLKLHKWLGKCNIPNRYGN